MEPLLRDVGYALRMLRKSPAFTLTAVLAIMLGTAAVTTIFTVVNTLLLAPPPAVGDPGALVDVSKRIDHGRHASVVSYPFYSDLARSTRTLAGLASWANAHAIVAVPGAGEGESHESRAALIVSGNYFDVLRVRPAAGRFFRPDEDSVPLARPVAVVSVALAEARLGGAANAVGRGIDLNGTRFTVVGVAPPDFGGTIALVKPDVFVPGMMASALRVGDQNLASSRNAGWLSMAGRLRDGVSAGAAQAELDAIAARIDKEHDTGNPGDRVTVSRLRAIPPQAQGVVTMFMAVLMTVAGLVLLIASVNVGNMMLARGVSRRKEFVVRLAIGATRLRLVRQLLTESVTLFLVGGVAGVLLTAWTVRVIERVHIDIDVPVTFAFAVDLRVLGFTLAVTFATAIIFGLVPALAASRGDLSLALRSDSAGVGDRRQRSRNAFVAGQLAMSVLLLVSAGLFLRALVRATRVSPGFEYQHVIAVPLSLRDAGYDSTTMPAYTQALAARVTVLPGVEGATFSSMPPLANNTRSTVIHVPGRPEPRRGEARDVAAFEVVHPDFFRVMRLPILAGRGFDATDRRGAPESVVVTAAFVRRYFAGLTPRAALGRTFTIGTVTETIVGVAGDGRFSSLTGDLDPFMFLSDGQQAPRDETLLVRTSGDPAQLAAQLSRLVRAVDPKLPIPKAQTLVSSASTGLLPQRVAALVTASLGALGLLLAAVGVYGVITYGVGQRIREIGVRMALGATERDVTSMVMRDGWRLAAIGLGVGLVLATLLSRLLSRFLLGVNPLDPITLGAVPLVLLGVTLLASWLPARRAARVDVARALRE